MSPDRLHSLYFLRVVATFMVVFGHAASFFQAFTFTQYPQFPSIQSTAVVLFFCLSGTTIAWVCDRSDPASSCGLQRLGRFTFDRFMRLAIPLIPVIVAFYIVEYLVIGYENHPHRQHFNIATAIGNALFLQNIYFFDPVFDFVGLSRIGPFGTNRPLWTLSIEFWTYILFAGFYFAVKDPANSRYKPMIAGFLALLILGRFVYDSSGAGLPIVWLLGALFYFVQKSAVPVAPKTYLVLLPAWLFAFVLLFKASTWPGQGYSHLYNLIIFTNFVFFVLICDSLVSSRWLVRATEFFGSFAYTTYLVHYPVLFLLESQGWLKQGNTMSVILGVAISFLVSWFFSLPFEQRYKKIRSTIWLALFSREERLRDA